MATKPTGLIHPDGRPIVRSTLGREIAAASQSSIRTIQSGHPAQGLDPAKLGRILRQAEDGDATAYYELAEEMEEKDLHYHSVLGTRKRAVAQLPIEVEPADETSEAKGDAALIEDWLKRDLLESELSDILDAVGKGVSSTEIVWDMKPDLWLPSRLLWRDPRWFEFDRVNGTDLLLRGGEDGVGEPSRLPAGKFITHYHPAKSGLPIRSGIARIAAWGYMFKNFAIKDWVTFLEQFGQPLRIGKYGPNESEENKQTLHRALYELGSDAAAAFPETMSVEFVDRKAGTAPNDLWRSHAEYFDMQISKAVLGQTNTTDAQSGGGIGSGQADVHNEVRGDIERADAKLLQATLNRDLVVPFIMLNRGPRDKYPRIKIGRPDPVDIKTEIESAEKLATMGVSIDGEEMRERAGLPAAKTDESALKPAKTAMPPETPQEAAERDKGLGTAKILAPRLLDPLKSPKPDDQGELQSQGQTEPREPDDIDLTIEDALDDWDVQIDPMLEGVDALIADIIEGGGDLAELQARLPEAIAEMDSTAFAAMLARGGFAAHLAGGAIAGGAERDDPAGEQEQ